MKIRVIDILRGTTVDGPGFRTAIYLAGCSHNCPGCHNPHTWDPEAGTEMDIDNIINIVKEEDFNVTLTGGDPLFNPEATIQLAMAINKEGYNIWLYTGYTLEEIKNRSDLRPILKWVDAIVDGPFVESLRDADLAFRGSSNQCIYYKPFGDTPL